MSRPPAGVFTHLTLEGEQLRENHEKEGRDVGALYSKGVLASKQKVRS